MEYGIINTVQSGIVLVLVGYVMLKAYRDRNRDKKHNYFNWLAFTAALSQLLSFVVRAVKTKLVYCGMTAQYVLYTGMFVSMAFTAWCAIRYLLYLRRQEDDIPRWARVLMLVPCIVMTVTAVSSPWTHWLFSVDGSLGYVRGSLFFLQLICPYSYALAAIIMMICMLMRRGNDRERAAVRYFLCFIVPAVSGAVLQVALGVDGGYSAIGVSISVVLLYMEFYIEEMREIEHLRNVAEANLRLQEQLDEIADLNDQLKDKQQLLEEAAEDQAAQIKETIRLNEKLLQQNGIVASAGLGIWYIFLKEDAAPRMQPNEKMSGLLGIEGMNLSEEEVYSFWHSRILPEALESVNRSVAKIISGTFDENTYKWNHPSKGVIYVRCGGNAVKLPDGTTVLSGYHADVTDIVSQEKERQKELESAMLEANRANEAKSLFLSRMSHDIRTPLNGIIGMIDMADRHPDDSKLQLDAREKAKTAAKHLLSLLNDVLELSKLDDANVTLAHEPFSILELARDVLTIGSATAAEYGVQMVHENCAQNITYPYVYGSPLHVRQILLNIISNAAKYNRTGGSIFCRTRMSSKTDTAVTYTVEIEDTGIGMSPEFMEHLFEPFTQEYSDARSTFKGTGLGMAIVKRLVDRMNGTIAVESTPGKGSRFTVSIPFEIAAEADVPERAAAEDSSIAGMRILLAEDNELNMEIAKSILEDFGTIVTEAVNGQQAVDIFEKNAPGTFDMILMDIMMPVLDGYGAARAIRKLNRPDAAEIPIIAMTANAFEEDRRNALEAGMNAHIAKPIEVNRLTGTLAGFRKRN